MCARECARYCSSCCNFLPHASIASSPRCRTWTIMFVTGSWKHICAYDMFVPAVLKSAAAPKINGASISSGKLCCTTCMVFLTKEMLVLLLHFLLVLFHSLIFRLKMILLH